MKTKKKHRVRSMGGTLKIPQAASTEAPLLGRRAALAHHAEQSGQKGAAAKSGLRGRAAFLSAHRHAGGAK